MNAILKNILDQAKKKYCCCDGLPTFERCDVHDIIDFIEYKYQKAMTCDCSRDIEEYYKE